MSSVLYIEKRRSHKNQWIYLPKMPEYAMDNRLSPFLRKFLLRKSVYIEYNTKLEISAGRD